MNFSREEFKRMAAGNYVLGKSTFDPKMLEAYVDGAMLYWDLQVAKKAKEKVDTYVIDNSASTCVSTWEGPDVVARKQD